MTQLLDFDEAKEKKLQTRPLYKTTNFNAGTALTRAEKQLSQARRPAVIDSLAGLITAPGSPFTTELIDHFVLVGHYLGQPGIVEKIAAVLQSPIIRGRGCQNLTII